MTDKPKGLRGANALAKSLNKELSANSTSLKYPDYFNHGQIKVLARLVEWSNNTTELIHVLEGPAGTGKTTVLNAFFDNIGKGGFAITAPTHKAVRIASQITGVAGKTLQKLLGLRPNYNVEDFDINNIPFDPLGKRSVDNYKLIVVDEASMINTSLKRYLERESSTHNTKILYVGDPYQLPPVKERNSSVFNILPAYKSTLREVVRQGEDNKISDLLIEIRKSISKKNYNYITYLNNNRNSIIGDKGFAVISDAEEFAKYVANAFNSEAFEKDINHCKYLAYTKLNLKSWNGFIRKSIFPDVKDVLHSDDLLIGNNTIVDEFNEAKIINSEDYIIHDIHPYRTKDEIEGFNVNFINMYNGNKTPYMFVVDYNNHASLNRFIYLANDLLSKAINAPYGRRSSLFKEYYTFKNKYLLLQDVEKSEYNSNFFSKDIDYGFGLTIHKSQGSTFNNVFVNLHNIIYANGSTPNTNIEMVNRLFYVAASRAKDSLIILM